MYRQVHEPSSGDDQLARLGPQAIEEYKRQKLREGLSPKSINNHLNVLGKCLSCAADWGRLNAPPRIRRLRVDPPHVDYLTADESRRLLNASGDATVRGMVRLALHTGLRLGELCGLRWSDVDGVADHLTVRRAYVHGQMVTPKSNRHRLIPVPALLLAEFENRFEPEALVFPRRDGSPQTPRSARHGLELLCHRAGIRSVGWHVLRHTFATQLVEDGTPLTAVKDLLGHSTITVTERYLHAAPSTLRKAILTLTERFAHIRPCDGQLAGSDAAAGVTNELTDMTVVTDFGAVESKERHPE